MSGMRSTACVFAALSLEPASWMVARGASSPSALMAVVSLHAAAAACAAFGLSWRLPESARSGRADVAVLFALGFFLPFAGVPCLLLGACRRLRPTVARATETGVDVLHLPELPLRAPAGRSSPFTEASLASTLRHAAEPGLRLRAVLAAGKMRDPSGVALLSEALKDRDDEVRLLAYALLDRTEREIYGRIKSDEAKLEEAAGPARARVHAGLAQHHWELVHLGLAQGDVAAHLLATAGKHAEEALSLSPRDGTTCVLLGRLHLAAGRLDEATAAFARALDCGLGEPVVRPYLAEIAFRRRDYGAVREQVKALAGGAAIERRVASFWS